MENGEWRIVLMENGKWRMENEPTGTYGFSR
jgi:hypothetical protein